MFKDVNARIENANVRIYPDVMEMQIELMLQMERGKALFRLPATPDSMLDIYQVMKTDNLEGLRGMYCRVSMDDETGSIRSIKNIMFDDFREIADEPVI